MKNMFLKEKTVSIITYLLRDKNPKYISQIAKETNCMYPHALSVLKSFEKLGYVSSKKEGRTRMYQLTSDGRKIAIQLKKLKKTIDESSETAKKIDKKLHAYKQKIAKIKNELKSEEKGEKGRKKRSLSMLKNNIKKINVFSEKNVKLKKFLLDEIDEIYSKL